MYGHAPRVVHNQAHHSDIEHQCTGQHDQARHSDIEQQVMG